MQPNPQKTRTRSRPPAGARLVPLTRKERVVIWLVIGLPCLAMTLALLGGAVWFLRTGVAGGRYGEVTRAESPFLFYLSVAVTVLLAVFTGSMAVNAAREK